MAAPPITERHKHHFHRQSPIKEAVRAATTANITIATALNNADTLDGVTLATGDRVLVKDQSAGAENGIYVVGVSPARDYDVSTDDPAFGYIVLVLQGTANAATLWQNTNTSAPTIGTTVLTFAAVSGGSGAPTTADYLVGTAQAGLSAEIVVGTTPGGELGGTWASPTVDATHSGSAHADFIAKAIVDAKGDIIAATAADTVARLAVGADGEFLMADSGETTGLAWSSPSGSGTVTTVKDEGSTLSSAVASIDFVGAGVTATGTTAVTVTIPGGGGSTEDPIADAFGTPDTAFEFATSSLTGLTTFGSPDVLDADTTVPDNLYVKDKNASFQWCGVYATASAAPGTVIAKVTGGEAWLSFHYVGVFLGVATPGELALSVLRASTGRTPGYWYDVTATAGDTGGSVSNINLISNNPPYYLAVVASSSTSFAFYWSSNGRTWVTTGSALNPTMTVGSFGVAINAGADNSTGVAASFEYVRYWTTAKTIPSVP